MSSASIGIVSARSAIERVVLIEDVGKAIVRWGLVVVLAWIGGMKFTAYEAMGIQPLVAHSPLVGWMYDFLDHPSDHGATNITRNFFERLNFTRLSRLLTDHQWDLAICTHFLPAALIATSEKTKHDVVAVCG